MELISPHSVFGNIAYSVDSQSSGSLKESLKRVSLKLEHHMERPTALAWKGGALGEDMAKMRLNEWIHQL
jgi:hypothetical protein